MTPNSLVDDYQRFRGNLCAISGLFPKSVWQEKILNKIGSSWRDRKNIK
jgi:hypothetical protein